MNSMGMKQRAMLAMLGVIVLYAIAAGAWFFSAESAWKKSRDRYEEACNKVKREVKLIGQKRQWEANYETEKASMPTFAADKATDTTWRRKLDEVAAKHHFVIASAQTGKEESSGDVLELPIDVGNWEGSLEALVRLMHELENTNEGMFDITQLNFRPNAGKRGYLRGSMTVNCAYMREQ